MTLKLAKLQVAGPVACAANSLSTFGQRGKVDIKFFFFMLLFLKTFPLNHLTACTHKLGEINNSLAHTHTLTSRLH